jgi:hypothetical protein
MSAGNEVAVTLSADLFKHLRTEAARLGIAIEWLVASLVYDTIDFEQA